MHKQLLGAESLTGLTLGISVSESADLERLGFLETHFRLALAEIARCVVVSGGNLVYGGHLRPDGYTSFLVRELERYNRRNQPLVSCLAWSEHRAMTLNQLRNEQKSLGLLGRLVCLDIAGAPIDPTQGRGEDVQPVENKLATQALSGLRQYLSNNSDARAFIGGKRGGYQGTMPGLLEEALYAFEKGQPVYLVGGFGGITLDIARAVGLDDAKRMHDFDGTQQQDKGTTNGLVQIVERAKKTNFQSLSNGLSDDENKRLVACYRPSEIATLIGLGLGRKFAANGSV